MAQSRCGSSSLWYFSWSVLGTVRLGDRGRCATASSFYHRDLAESYDSKTDWETRALHSDGCLAVMINHDAYGIDGRFNEDSRTYQHELEAVLEQTAYSRSACNLSQNEQAARLLSGRIRLTPLRSETFPVDVKRALCGGVYHTMDNFEGAHLQLGRLLCRVLHCLS